IDQEAGLSPRCECHRTVDVCDFECVVGLVGGGAVAKVLGSNDCRRLIDKCEQDAHNDYDEDYDCDYPSVETRLFRYRASYRCAWRGYSRELPCQLYSLSPYAVALSISCISSRERISSVPSFISRASFSLRIPLIAPVKAGFINSHAMTTSTLFLPCAHPIFAKAPPNFSMLRC